MARLPRRCWRRCGRDRPGPSGRGRHAPAARTAARRRRGARRWTGEAPRHQRRPRSRRGRDERLRALLEPLGGRVQVSASRSESGPGPGRGDMEFGTGSHINIPIAILIWLMIYPMMLKIDFASVKGVGSGQVGRCHPRRELAGEAVLDGLPRLALLPPRLHAVDRARARSEYIAGSAWPPHPARRWSSSVVPLRRRPRLSSRWRERPDHAGRLRPGREVPRLGSLRSPRAVRRPSLLGSDLRGHPAGGRVRQPQRAHRKERPRWFGRLLPFFRP